MEKRRKELLEIHDFIEEVDKETKIILQNLKWDKKRIFEDVPKATCTYDKSHKLAPDKMECHERQCFLKLHRYDKDLLLPDPLHFDADTLIKLDKQAIISIINNATCGNPLFKQGIRSKSPEPWTLERLQATYTADERRALHDAVVQAVPSCHDLADLALPSTEDGAEHQRVKSRAEILAELRDMKRRRPKYRVAAKTRKYSDVLRDVIRTQMELYTDAAHQTRGNEKDLSSLKQEPSSRDNYGQYLQNENFASNFSRRNTERRAKSDRSNSRDRGRRQPQDYHSNSYTKYKDRMMSKKVFISPAEERERHHRNDYPTSSYDQREKKYSSREKREHQSRDYSTYEGNNYREPALPDDSRETRRRHKYSNTSIYDENNDDQPRRRAKKDTSHDYSYTARPRKRHRENSASAEKDEIPSRSKYKETRNKHSDRSSRERNTGGDGKIRVKSERDRSPDRDLSETETRYDYVYTSRRPKRERESSEKHDHETRNRRNEEMSMSIKRERETPGRESNEIDTQSNYTRTSTYISSRHNDYSSSSETGDTNARGDRTRDYNKDSHKRDKYGQTNVRIKKTRDDTHEQQNYHHHKSKRNKKKHPHGNRPSGETERLRNRERESRHGNKYKSGHRNERDEDTRIHIKKERNVTPSESPGYIKKERADCQYDGNTTQGRSGSNSSWE